jgi:hypothetical protein
MNSLPWKVQKWIDSCGKVKNLTYVPTTIANADFTQNFQQNGSEKINLVKCYLKQLCFVSRSKDKSYGSSFEFV